jgi:1,4-dihydroxy-2-naphthoyl-CoA hydrolase
VTFPDGANMLESINNGGRGTLIESMGITVTEASADRVVATMPVAGNTQPYGLLHGGASCVLAETLGSIATALHAGPDNLAFGVEINASHHRSATEGIVTGVAQPLHRGRTMATYDVEITDEQGRRLCTSRITCAIRPAR